MASELGKKIDTFIKAATELGRVVGGSEGGASSATPSAARSTAEAKYAEMIGDKKAAAKVTKELTEATEKNTKANRAQADSVDKTTEASRAALEMQKARQRQAILEARAEAELSLALQDVNKEIQRQTASRVKLNKTQTESARNINDLQGLLQRQISVEKISLQLKENAREITGELTGAQEKEKQSLENMRSALQDQIKSVLALTKQNDLNGLSLESLTALGNDHLVGLIKTEAQTQRSTESQDKFRTSLRSSGRNLIQTTLGIGQYDGVLKNLGNTLGNASDGENVLSGAMMDLIDPMSAANLAFDVAQATLNKFIEATVMGAKASLEITKTLGAELGLLEGIADSDAIIEMSQQSELATVTIGALSESMASMQRDTQGMFGNLAKGEKGIAEFGVEMKTLGVSLNSTGKLFNILGKTMGVDHVEDIKKASKEIVKMSRAYGVSADEVTGKIAGLTETFALFGEQAIEIAMDMQKMSLNTKVSTESMTKFTDSFKTWPAAIQASQDLNLAFDRTTFSSQEMWKAMKTDPGKAYKMMLQGVWNEMDLLDEKTMSGRMKMAQMADTLKMSEPEFAKLVKQMKGANAAGDSFGDMMTQNDEKIKATAATAANFALITDELAKLQEQFAIPLGEVMGFLGGIVKWINAAMSGMPTWGKALTGLGIAAGAFYAGVKIMIKGMGFMVRKTMEEVVGSEKQAQRGMKAIGDEALRSAAKVETLGAAMRQTHGSGGGGGGGLSDFASPTGRGRGRGRGRRRGGGRRTGGRFSGKGGKVGGGLAAMAGMAALDIGMMAMSDEEVNTKDLMKTAGGFLGGAAGWALGAALAPATGGLSLLLPMAFSIGGSMLADTVVDAAVDDFILKDGKLIEVNPGDTITGAKAGGPLAKTFDTAADASNRANFPPAAAMTPTQVTLKVDLFGQELIDTLVDLVEAGRERRVIIQKASGLG